MKDNFIILEKKFKEYFRTKFLKTLETFQTNVVLAHRMLENVARFPKRAEAEPSEFSFMVEPKEISATVKENFKKWIIIAGFDELFKWIKELLIDYIFLKEALLKKNLPSNEDEFNKLKLNLYELHIPPLIGKCKALIGDIGILEHYHSYNKVRNCLHHSNEILTEKFCTKGMDILEIKGRRFALISDNGKETKEVELGENGLENGALKLIALDFSIVKKKGERISISLKEFTWMKDLAIFLYSELASDLFGPDDRPTISISIAHKVVDVEKKIM